MDRVISYKNMVQAELLILPFRIEAFARSVRSYGRRWLARTPRHFTTSILHTVNQFVPPCPLSLSPRSPLSAFSASLSLARPTLPFFRPAHTGARGDVSSNVNNTI